MSEFLNLPPQQLSFSSKGKAWRKKHLDWADSRTYWNHDTIRNTIRNKKINYDLVNGHLHMDDLLHILNPEGVSADYVPSQIQHYPIMNSKINVLIGEESARVFDYKVVITNPNAISEMEEQKKAEIFQHLQALIQNTAISEEQMQAELEKLNEQFTYNWQDMREIMANEILRHYSAEQEFPLLFNEGFMDALTVGEEIYRCSIVGGEPIMERLNPLKVKVFKSGFSSKIEDADIITIEDYWSPGRIIDTFHEQLTTKDRQYIESLGEFEGSYDEMGNYDDRVGLRRVSYGEGEGITEISDIAELNPEEDPLCPYDMSGNIKVLTVYWKSRRKVKKVTRFNPEIGEEEVMLMPETYVINKDLGETEKVFYINEAWEGTKIGDEVYINMRPCPIQYNRLSNPSKCHFGIVGSIYNVNESQPFSLVDIMKRYNYLYDVVHNRLNKLIANNWGKMISLDLAKVPEGWDIDKWMYYAKISGIAVVDSFKEGNYGAATGKLAGALNNASNGVIDAELGNSIQSHIATLEYIKSEMSEVAGISRQREGQISNRETVGGVERATLQSSHITEHLFTRHESVKKRAMLCFLETAKIALKGNKSKMTSILSDNSRRIIELDGDIFSELDYGLVVENSSEIQEMNQKLDTLAQAALQNQAINFSAVMQVYNSSSLSEKQTIIRRSEEEMQRRRQEEMQHQQQMQQQQLDAQMQQLRLQQEFQERLNQQNNDTKIAIAKIQAEAQIIAMDGSDELGYMQSEQVSKDNEKKLAEEKRQFDINVELEKLKIKTQEKIKMQEIAQKQRESNKKSNSSK